MDKTEWLNNVKVGDMVILSYKNLYHSEHRQARYECIKITEICDKYFHDEANCLYDKNTGICISDMYKNIPVDESCILEPTQELMCLVQKHRLITRTSSLLLILKEFIDDNFLYNCNDEELIKISNIISDILVLKFNQ